MEYYILEIAKQPGKLRVEVDANGYITKAPMPLMKFRGTQFDLLKDAVDITSIRRVYS